MDLFQVCPMVLLFIFLLFSFTFVILNFPREPRFVRTVLEHGYIFVDGVIGKEVCPGGCEKGPE